MAQTAVGITSLIQPHLSRLTPYQAGKPLEELTRELGLTDAIKLASNENPLGPSPLALAAIQAELPNLHRYPDSHAYYLKEELSRHLNVKPEQLVLGNGSDEILDLLIRTLVSPGDEVVSAAHTFLMYGLLTQAGGGVYRPVPLKNKRLDLPAVAQAVTPKTKVILLNNPNNPTGTVFHRDEWEAFLAALPPTVTVVLDEAYIEFADDPEVPQGLDYLAEDRLLVGLRTFSKAYGLAGLRVGYGYGPSELMDFINRLRLPFNVNRLAQAGARAALKDGEFLQRTRKLVSEGRAFLCRELSRLGLEYVPSQANFILIGVPRPGQEVYQAMLKEGVIVRAMDAYGFPECIRVNVGRPEENERFLKTLKKVLGL
jgi:histidinol-phosphate aminotransferase|uniref:Histidinol-phosphate aminotransferase n=1 Tax=Desulfobacca acetoxidans TaxID=60893 RepID=A0A7C3WG56_9BACT